MEKVNTNTSFTVYVSIKDENGVVIPLASPYLFNVIIKVPYGNLNISPISTGVTGPTVIYGTASGPSQFYFTSIATKMGDYKYKIQYDSTTTSTGSYGPAILAATVGTIRAVDDDF